MSINYLENTPFKTFLYDISARARKLLGVLLQTHFFQGLTLGSTLYITFIPMLNLVSFYRETDVGSITYIYQKATYILTLIAICTETINSRLSKILQRKFDFCGKIQF